MPRPMPVRVLLELMGIMSCLEIPSWCLPDAAPVMNATPFNNEVILFGRVTTQLLSLVISIKGLSYEEI